MFKASANVTAIGSPSGTAITISVTAIMKYFSTTSAILIQSLVLHNGFVMMSCPRNPTKANIETAEPILLIILASLSSCMLSGVFICVISIDFVATLPISVASPTAVTRKRPFPFITIVDLSTTFEGYVAPSFISFTFLEMIGSPVSADSSICNSVASSSLPSAGISSPTPMTITSPTTTLRCAISTTLPFLHTFTGWSSPRAVSSSNRFAASRSK